MWWSECDAALGRRVRVGVDAQVELHPSCKNGPCCSCIGLSDDVRRVVGDNESGEGLPGEFRRTRAILEVVHECGEGVEGFTASGGGNTGETGNEGTVDNGGEVGLEPEGGFTLLVA